MPNAMSTAFQCPVYPAAQPPTQQMRRSARLTAPQDPRRALHVDYSARVRRQTDSSTAFDGTSVLVMQVAGTAIFHAAVWHKNLLCFQRQVWPWHRAGLTIALPAHQCNVSSDI